MQTNALSSILVHLTHRPNINKPRRPTHDRTPPTRPLGHLHRTPTADLGHLYVAFMTEPYLILHRVRGEPAFDIAHKITIGDEEGWIVSTSGHRAYPYWSQQIGEIVQGDIYDGWLEGTILDGVDLLDHFPTPRAAPYTPIPHGSLAQRLGLVPKAPKIERKI